MLCETLNFFWYKPVDGATMNIETISAAKNMMSDSKFFMGYSRFDDNLRRYEHWDESVWSLR